MRHGLTKLVIVCVNWYVKRRKYLVWFLCSLVFEEYLPTTGCLRRVWGLTQDLTSERNGRDRTESDASHRDNCPGIQRKSCSIKTFQYTNSWGYTWQGMFFHTQQMVRFTYVCLLNWIKEKKNPQSDPKSDNSSIGKWQVCLLASYIPVKFSSLPLFSSFVLSLLCCFLQCGTPSIRSNLFNLLTGCLSLVNCHEELKDEVNRKIFCFHCRNFRFEALMRFAALKTPFWAWKTLTMGSRTLFHLTMCIYFTSFQLCTYAY